MFNKIYKGMTKGELIWCIHFECDTSAGLYSMSDSQVIAVYKDLCEKESCNV